MLSLCVIDVEHGEPGTDVTVVWGNPGEPQREIRAKVAAAPYKKDSRRVDVSKL
jgi:vanillate/3-O-methylgallate O-demethylase